MKTDLKTNIKFYQVSSRYYRPENEIVLASLTRYEKVPTTIMESAEQGAREAACEVMRTINQCVETRGRCVIGFGAGRHVLRVYDELVKLYFADKVSFADVVAFNLSELGVGLDEGLNLNTLINDNRKSISSLCFELGKAYYQAHYNSDSCEFSEQVNQIRTLLAGIEEAEERIKRLKGIKKCPNCGSDVPAQTAFCPHCGTQVGEVAPRPRICPSCGKTAPEGSSFCVYCGTKLNG